MSSTIHIRRRPTVVVMSHTLLLLATIVVTLFVLVQVQQYKNRSDPDHDDVDVFRRTLQQIDDEPEYYYTLNDTAILGKSNPNVAMGNPLKGLVTSPAWTGDITPSTLPTSLEFYYIGLDEIMYGNNQFDWTFLDHTLEQAASRYKHVIWRVYCHYPGRPLAVPQYLLNQNIPIVQGSPIYDDARLLTALEQFIAAFGLRYDGHKSLAFIQMGLLGYWGEWHTYPETGLLSDTTKQKVYTWYENAFTRTKLQTRDPLDAPDGKVGFHDDSFGYTTIGPIHWYFWPKIVETGNGDTWKRNVIGGETKPDMQSMIFEPTYQPDIYKNKADFMECVRTTHATYIIHGNAFENNGYAGTELKNAQFAHARMGYNYIVTKVGVLSTAATAATDIATVSIDVTLMQTGVAPFYYPLSLVLYCTGTRKVVTGVERGMADKYSSARFRFDGIPINAGCLQGVTLQLESRYTYKERPIKFAQGKGIVSFAIPLPQGLKQPISNTPVRSPISVPSPSSAGTRDTAITLMLLDANKNGTIISRMTNGMKFSKSKYPNVRIQAELINPNTLSINKVEFKYNRITRIEYSAPYSFYGTGIFGSKTTSWSPFIGNHTIRARVFLNGSDKIISTSVKFTTVR